MNLTGRNIVLGVTGGIAAYKSAEIVSRLRHSGANVHVIMTRNATEFVAPLTFRTLSANPVAINTFEAPEYWNVEHVALAKWADLFVIAPATANILAKMAHGIADDMLSTTVLATKAPVLAAPAMNTGMWTAESTQRCGTSDAVVKEFRKNRKAGIVLVQKQDLAGRKVLITAGATRERMDPVRYLTNDSSGKMGFAIAEAARDRGAEVTLIKGNTTAPVPTGIRIVEIESAQDLLRVMKKAVPGQDIVIQAAAVADYRPVQVSKAKIKKKAGEPITLQLTENPDIAKAIGGIKKKHQTFVGFAAETDHVKKNAEAKLSAKNLDLIVANDVTRPGAGFNADTNIVTLITRDSSEDLPMMSKRKVAEAILDKILSIRTGS